MLHKNLQKKKLDDMFYSLYKAKPNVLAIRTFKASADFQTISDFFDFHPEESEFPCIALRDNANSINYRYRDNYDPEKLQKFFDDIEHKRIDPFVRNEKDVPVSTGLVEYVNSEKLHNMVLNNSKHSTVVLFFHSAYPEMEKNIPILEEVAKKLSDHPELRFVAMNVSTNDVHPDITNKFGNDLAHINLFIEDKHCKQMPPMEVTEYHICELLVEHLKLTNPYPKPVIDHKTKIQDLMSETSEYEDDLTNLSKDVDDVAAEDGASGPGKDQSSSHSEEDVL